MRKVGTDFHKGVTVFRSKQCLASTTDDQWAIIDDVRLGWIGCMDHLINLSVNDVIRNMSEMKNVLASIRQVVMYTRTVIWRGRCWTSTKRHSVNVLRFGFVLDHHWKDCLLGYTHRQLIFDVKTRWNSTFYMIQRFIEEKICVTACLDEKLFQKHLTSAKVSKVVDWDTLESLKVRKYWRD